MKFITFIVYALPPFYFDVGPSRHRWSSPCCRNIVECTLLLTTGRNSRFMPNDSVTREAFINLFSGSLALVTQQKHSVP